MHTPLFGRRLLLSPQSFQRLCRYGTTAPLSLPRASQIAERGRRAAPNLTQKQKNQAVLDHDDGKSFRFFEQDPETGAIERVEDNHHEKQAADLLKQLHEASERVQAYGASIDSETFHNSVLELFPQDARSELAEFLRRERERRANLQSALEIRMNPTSLVEPVIQQVNRCLKHVADDPSDASRHSDLWKWFFRAKRSITSFSNYLSPEAWDTLWSILPAEGRTRDSRVLELSDGMIATGKQLSVKQRDERGKALVKVGRRREALAEWERQKFARISEDTESLESGMGLYAMCGEISRGIMVMQRWLDTSSEGDYKAALALINAGARLPKFRTTAYAAYLALKHRFGHKLQLEDYDAIISSFLVSPSQERQGSTLLARAVFRDQLSTQLKSQIVLPELLQEEQKYVERRIGKQKVQIQVHIDEQDLSALYWPNSWQNKFIYASWLRRLISNGDVKGTSQVLTMMYKQGVRPDALHVNGLIGALIRSDDVAKVMNAESLAWSMIRKRLQHVIERGDTDSPAAEKLATLSLPSRLENKDQITILDRGMEESTADAGPPITIDPVRPLPPANAETFNVLGLQYLLTQQWARLRRLVSIRAASALPLTTFFMNHILYLDLWTSGPDVMWRRFLHLVTMSKPDLETYNCLWHAAQDAVSSGPSSETETTVMPYPRELFGSMVAWRETLDDKASEAVAAEFGQEVYARIILTLCNKKDYIACMVAMHAALKVFGAGPTKDVAPLLVRGLADVYVPGKQRPAIRAGALSRRRRIMGDPKLVQPVEELLARITRERELRTRREGLSEGDLSEGDMASLTVNALTQLVWTVLVRVIGDKAQIVRRIEEAERKMGVPRLVDFDFDTDFVR